MRLDELPHARDQIRVFERALRRPLFRCVDEDRNVSEDRAPSFRWGAVQGSLHDSDNSELGF